MANSSDALNLSLICVFNRNVSDGVQIRGVCRFGEHEECSLRHTPFFERRMMGSKKSYVSMTKVVKLDFEDSGTFLFDLMVMISCDGVS